MEFVNKYFIAERNESILFICIGIVAMVMGLSFVYSNKSEFQKGSSIPFITIAIIQIVVGTTVYIRSPKDIQRVNQIIKNDVKEIDFQELPRMDLVVKNFKIYRFVEMALILLAVLLFFFLRTNLYWKGFAIALFIQSVVMLSLDFFAEKRADVYLHQLQDLI